MSSTNEFDQKEINVYANYIVGSFMKAVDWTCISDQK